MNGFYVSALTATLLCALTAGLLFTFAVVVMPGIRSLRDRDFLQAFKVMDGIIQQNDPRFIVVWVGSVIALGAALFTGLGTLEGIDRILLLGAAVVYVLCVQLPTILVNVPLNNRLQSIEIERQTESSLRDFRTEFERRWNVWNAFRTVCASATVLALLVMLLRT